MDKIKDDWMPFSKFTGEKLPFITPYSSTPDAGVENVGEDTCHTEEYIPITDIFRKYLRDGIPDLSDEFSYDEDDVNFEDSPVDAFDEDDPLERQILLEEYAERHPAETQMSDSAGRLSASSANDEQVPLETSEEVAPQQSETAKPSE